MNAIEPQMRLNNAIEVDVWDLSPDFAFSFISICSSAQHRAASVNLVNIQQVFGSPMHYLL